MPRGSARWYQTTLGIVLAGLVGMVVFFVLGFVALTGYYTWIIKKGGGSQIAAQLDATFTKLQGAGGQATKNNRAELEKSSLPALGNEQAATIIVEFVDFKCPNCRAAAPILAQLMARRGRDVALLVRHFPIESIHPGASRLALFAQCASAQGLFWPAYNLLFARQDQIGPAVTDDEIALLAGALSLDQTKLTACLKSNQTRVIVERDYSAGVGYGVRGTPTFFLNGQKVEGVVPLNLWEEFLNKK